MRKLDIKRFMAIEKSLSDYEIKAEKSDTEKAEQWIFSAKDYLSKCRRCLEKAANELKKG